ncbi:mitochondrial carrier [Coprinopsis marcescibilis]|uniref:Mitochondrial carrier n=1 Tax=Coprinopsis marcescibilis TaxID=230819 RepID=A0A5C3LBB1_COPMA|nr:mitochondrial carrier [Coprinopsis marcescibilis]
MSQNATGDSHVRLLGAVAGMGSGLTKVAVGHGFDTIKTRMQCAAPGTYQGAFDIFKHIVRNEGPLALYKGATPPAVGWAAIDSVLLGSLHNYRLILFRQGMTEPAPQTGAPRLTLLGHGIAGLFAGCTSAVIATPVELLKVKLQLQSQRAVTERRFSGPVHCLREVIRVQGVLGLWSGFSGTVASRVNFFWMFLSFEFFMRGFSKLAGTPFEVNVGLANFLSGGFGAFSYWIMAIPADNIKNRMMAFPYPDPYPAAISKGTIQVPSFSRTAREIFAREGYTGFFRGLGPSLLRAFPVNASALFVYEGIMRVMGAEKTRQ